MYVIGTAGHVDHGKSTLIEALTGIDPDRLAEEKEREMTIDLGFAWIQLGDDGETVGIVDVPGHRDFIENMLAGVGGIDMAVFVVAADEGVMPQTTEHLAILNLLEINGGVIALTKIDMVDDPDWIELVTLDLHETLEGTVLENAPIMPVSAKTGEGLAALREMLWKELQNRPERADNGRPQLPVDRVFTLSGFGTVVTGTLTNGRLQLGDTIEIQPSGRKGRVRGLQTHNHKIDIAHPGSRVAINLTGIGRDEVKRGDVIAAPNVIGNTILLDAAYTHLASAGKPLKHNTEVKLFIGAAEVMARARVLGDKQIEAGQNGWLQLALAHPIATARGDKFILRRPSPGMTIGGGRVLDPQPGRRHRRFKGNVTARLQTLAEGTPSELLMQRLARLEPAKAERLIGEVELDRKTAVETIKTLEEEGQIVRVSKLLFTHAGWQRLIQKMITLTTAHHRQNRLRLGIPREELRSKLQVKPSIFTVLIEQAVNDGTLQEDHGLLRLPNHSIRFTGREQTAVDQLLRDFADAEANSPSVKLCKTAVTDDVYFALIDLGELIQLNTDVVYTKDEYTRIRQQIINYLEKKKKINASELRTLLNSSRKYSIAILEHLDEIKVTRRIGDYREMDG